MVSEAEVISFLEAWGLLIGILVIALIILVIRWFRGRKKKKKNIDKVKKGLMNMPEEQEDVPPDLPPLQQEFSRTQYPEPRPERRPAREMPRQAKTEFDDFFSDDELDKDNDGKIDLLQKVDEVVNVMDDEDYKVDKTMSDDLQETMDKLDEVKRTKDQVKKYGKSLAKLYNKYDARQRQLEVNIMAMNRLLKRVGDAAQRPSIEKGYNPDKNEDISRGPVRQRSPPREGYME